jgi:TPR repeat protein
MTTHERARFWRLRLASWLGDSAAMYDLASACELGVGTPPNDLAATHWHQRAAARGDARSMAALGKRYAAGQTFPENKIDALMWLSLATDFCNADVLRRVFVWQRDELAAGMSAADQETAARRAQEWREAFLSQRRARPPQ